MRANEKREGKNERLSSQWSVVPLWELVGTIRLRPNAEWDGCAIMPDAADETSSTQHNIQPWAVGCTKEFAVDGTEAMESSFIIVRNPSHNLS